MPTPFAPTDRKKFPLFEIAGNVHDGYAITSPLFPELVTGGSTVEEALGNLPDAIGAVTELYKNQKQPFPNILPV